MRLTAAEVARIVGGTLHGDPSVVATDVASLECAGPGDASFVLRDRLKEASACGAAVLVVPEPVAGFAGAQVVADDPYRAFVRLLEVVAAERRPAVEGIHPTAVVEGAEWGEGAAIGPHATVRPGARIGPRTRIGAGAYIGEDSTIGADCFIAPNVTILERVTIGDRCIINANTTIGGPGFGYLDYTRSNIPVPQVGRVVIGDDVEIGCHCTVDRATMDATVIGNNVKIDNHSHIAHNVRIGDHCVLVAYARIGGGTVIGNRVLLAEDVGVTDHVTVGDGCILAGTAKISKDIPPGSVVWGNPAQDIGDEKRERAALRRLPRMMEEFRELKRRMARMKDEG